MGEFVDFDKILEKFREMFESYCWEISEDFRKNYEECCKWLRRKKI